MTIIFRSLGRQSYVPVWQAMQRFTDCRNANTVDEIWFVEHEPVYTQGMAGKAEHILNPGNIPVVPIDRGGQVTYHGPGQCVVYFLLDIERRALSPRQLVTKIERAIIELLARYQINAYARQDAPGIYIKESEEKKIASIGLRIRRHASYHGLSLNVNMNLAPFYGINPCGFAGLKMTQLKDYMADIGLNAVESIFKPILAKAFS